MKSVSSSIQNLIIYLYFISIHFDQANLFGLGIDFLASKITITLFIIVSVLDFRHFYSFNKLQRYFLPIVIYFLLLTIRSFFNQSSYYPTYFELTTFLQILIFILLSNHSKTEENILLKGLLAFSISLAILSFFESFGIKLDVYEQGRFSVFGENTNEMGLRLCISLLVLLAVIFENKTSTWEMEV